LGLTFLLFMVGLEIDFDKVRGRPLTLAVGGWCLSLFVALAPILRDRGELNTKFDTYMVAAAAAGEFGPLVVISMLLIPTHSIYVQTLFMVSFRGSGQVA
jgi:Kef-type K+ transport system membrane component KefB